MLRKLSRGSHIPTSGTPAEKVPIDSSPPRSWCPFDDVSHHGDASTCVRTWPRAIELEPTELVSHVAPKVSFAGP
jgi:hypothetical protein